MEGSNKKKMSSEDVVGLELPSDIIFEILARLRVKTLYKFRCVSKSWHALVSDPLFIENHQRRCERNPLLLIGTRGKCCDTSRGCTRFHLSTLDKANKLQTIFAQGSSDFHTHMVLFTTCLNLVCIYDSKKILVCNPAMEELIPLPENCSLKQPAHLFGVGLGYLPFTREYKVIRHVWFGSTYEATCYEVFTLGGGGNNFPNKVWRAIASPPSDYVATGPTFTFATGAFYVLKQHRTINHFLIARFNLEQDKWSMLPLPDEVDPILVELWTVELTTLKGLLFLADFGTSRWSRVDLWALKDGSVWVNEYSVDMSPWPELIQRDVDNRLEFLPFHIDEEDGRILMHEINKGVMLHYYDPKTKTFQERDTGKLMVARKEVIHYVESFISLRALLK